MVWGGISIGGRKDLHIIRNGTLTGRSCEGLNPAFAPTAHVMVWGAIAYDTRSPLVLIRGSMTLCDHIMSALDLRSGFLQMAVNPSHIVKTAFVMKNGTYAFRRMPFGLSGNASNFQKAID
ncbi:hypothetical protein TNCV_753691 [Trichonephila clavipes]|nr:hypothetical protein TNCV_753691 [Trichonephila clavipes]